MKKKTKHRVWSVKMLLALGIPMVLIPGILFARQHGWRPNLQRTLSNSVRFPHADMVKAVEDGDTFVLSTDLRVRMIASNAPERGESNFERAKKALSNLILAKTVYLEYDRYQDDKYGRILAWVWIDCETDPNFLPFDYMHASQNQSRIGLTDNPKGCSKGKLVNEEMIKNGLSSLVVYQDRGELKYEKRIREFKGF